ncbi:MAG: aldehyde ferredoxin oxidoreductase family protein, partial [Deltaproteobacteria bacterium]|nr:aldehyde ferredoxin oxidoreductase family protein [Deltaproteobacteria bacterium]
MKNFGKKIEIDLSSGRIEHEALSEADVRRSLGGFGFNIEHLYRRVETEMDPLDPANLLVISRGLLTGTVAPSSSRVHVNGLSPQSGLIGSSNVGGFLGFRMYSLGLNSLVITGRAGRPVYLYVGPGGVEIRDAKHLWGLDTRATEERLYLELSSGDLGRQDTDLLTIGPAGENGVLFACIMAGWDHAAGRTGLGTLMGAKNLKAVVLQAGPGKEKMTASQAEVVREYVGRMKKSVSRYRDFSTYGSAGDILETNQMGMLGTRNYQNYQLENAERIDGRQLDRYVRKKSRCHRCPISCKAEIELPDGRYAGFKGGRPEYETIIDLGSLCGLTDAEALLYLSNLCNMLGLDTISTGSVIAFAMELYQRGILTRTDTGGMPLAWGDADAMEALIRQIAHREGLGAILAKGVKQAAEIIGRGAEKYAYHVKGVELYGGDPRGAMGVALAYAVSMRGGDYTSVYPIAEMRYSPEQAESEFGTREVVDLAATGGKGAMVKKCMTVSAVIDSLGLCKVPALSIIGDLKLDIESRMIRAITGLHMSPSEILYAGERILHMEKIINIRQKSGPEDDTLPDLFLDTPVREGPMQGRKVDLAPMIAEF